MDKEAGGSSGETEPKPVAPSTSGRSLHWIGMAASVLLFAASLAVLYTILSDVDPAEIRKAFGSATLAQLATAALFTAASYLLLSGYDLLALRQLRARMRYRIVSLASFTSFAISFTLGFPLLTAGTVRYWIYAPRGLSAGKVASLTLIAGFTFLLGMATVLAAALLFRGGAISEINHLSTMTNRIIGAGGLTALVGYLAYVGFKRRAIRVKRWRIELPGLGASLGQIAIGVLDLVTASMVLYTLMPQGHGIPFETFAAVYALAAMLGMASHAPGGVGVFEATFLLAFVRVPYEGMLGALLMFRVCYYLIPFVLALLLLGAMEITSRLRAYRARIEGDADADMEP